jgi:hypothetical protein
MIVHTVTTNMAVCVLTLIILCRSHIKKHNLNDFESYMGEILEFLAKGKNFHPSS